MDRGEPAAPIEGGGARGAGAIHGCRIVGTSEAAQGSEAQDPSRHSILRLTRANSSTTGPWVEQGRTTNSLTLGPPDSHPARHAQLDLGRLLHHRVRDRAGVRV